MTTTTIISLLFLLALFVWSVRVLWIKPANKGTVDDEDEVTDFVKDLEDSGPHSWKPGP